MNRELNEKQQLVRSLKEQEESLVRKWQNMETSEDMRQSVNNELSRLRTQHRQGVECRSITKLSKLYGGNIKLPRPTCGYVNLVPGLELTQDQEELLNFGLNCHFNVKPRKHRKRIELEVLLDNIHSLEKAGKVTTTTDLQSHLITEASKERGPFRSSLVHQRHIEAAKQLKSNENIIIRRADKTAAFVIMRKEEYLNKMDNILSDTTKFKKITRNPTDTIKKKINTIIKKIHATKSTIRLPVLTGEYSAGYAYGTVKTHKNGNPLRPIISQIPTPSYLLAKKLNDILTPYIPNDYALASAQDFLEILKTTPQSQNNIIASLDVESLFTNVPVDRTIEFILDRVYRCNDTPSLDIPEDQLRELLKICTKEAPFTCPRGEMYCQIDGVAMGSPLGVLFANFFMGSTESTVVKKQRPAIYARYVDDIFVCIKDTSELLLLKEELQKSSGLNFTYEESKEGRLPFLDILVTAQEAGFKTTVYTKKTNTGLCLNGNSECPQNYINSTISAYIKRALTHCSTWENTHEELQRITQVLVNNGYKNTDINNAIKKEINKFQHQTKTKNNEEYIKLYYKSRMSPAYKT